MNVLDLGFFASLQSKTDTITSRNLDELIAKVENEFQNYDVNDLRNVFLTLQEMLHCSNLSIVAATLFPIVHERKEAVISLL